MQRNTLRGYKAKVSHLQREFEEHKKQSNTRRKTLQDHSVKAQEKLKELRHEKEKWIKEATAMRAADKEAKVRSRLVHPEVRRTEYCLQETFAAQGKLLEEALQKVFQLEIKIKENAPKVDRLHDYEKQIDQLMTLQRLWYVRVLIL